MNLCYSLYSAITLFRDTKCDLYTVIVKFGDTPVLEHNSCGKKTVREVNCSVTESNFLIKEMKVWLIGSLLIEQEINFFSFTNLPSPRFRLKNALFNLECMHIIFLSCLSSYFLSWFFFLLLFCVRGWDYYFVWLYIYFKTVLFLL